MNERDEGLRRTYSERVEPGNPGPTVQRVQTSMSSRIIGQHQAIARICRGLVLHETGLTDPEQPIGTYVLIGPTGVGKSMTAGEFARAWIGSAQASSESRPPITRIQCAKYVSGHEIAELIGSPKGYYGHNTGQFPRLHQASIDAHHIRALGLDNKLREAVKNELRSQELRPDEQYERRAGVFAAFTRDHDPFRSVILFDEFEKATSRLQDLLLHVVEDGELDVLDGSTTRFTNSVIFLAGNVGSQELGRGVGFDGRRDFAAEQEQTDYQKARAALGKIFSPEMMSRLEDAIIVYRRPRPEELRRILHIQLAKVAERVGYLSGGAEGMRYFSLEFTDDCKQFLIARAKTEQYGARQIKKVVRRYVAAQLAELLDSSAIVLGDSLLFDADDKTVVVRRLPSSGTPRLAALDWRDIVKSAARLRNTARESGRRVKKRRSGNGGSAAS